MDDPRWLRLMIVGLILAAIAVGYFLIAGKFSKNTTVKDQAAVVKTAEPSVLGQNASPSPKSAYNMIVDRNLGNLQTLPKTAFPVEMFAYVSAGAAIAGWGLRKYPK